MKKFKSYMLEKLQDRKEAELFLKGALEEYENDHNIGAFMLALRDIADAQGGITELANQSHISRQHLYKVFSSNVSPKVDTLDSILQGLGFRLSVEPLKKAS